MVDLNFCGTAVSLTPSIPTISQDRRNLWSHSGPMPYWSIISSILKELAIKAVPASNAATARLPGSSSCTNLIGR